MSYDRTPSVRFDAADAIAGWPAVAARLNTLLDAAGALAIDCYPGVDAAEIEAALALPAETLVVRTAGLMLPFAKLDTLLARFLTDDRVFGYMAPFELREFFDEGALADAAAQVEAARAEGRRVVVIGPGAAWVAPAAALVYADMPRWELQLRLRAGLANLTADNPAEDFLVKYKRGYFIEWRAADRWKVRLFDRVELFLDTTRKGDPSAVGGAAMRTALAAVVRRPFRVMPFFDPGVWGGQWMRRSFPLPDGPSNYAWGFDCVPEENSLLIDFGAVRLEVPSINVVLRHPEALLGPKVFARFGPEFPIRFDFLDTIDGGNLSLQVHPLVGYARDKFGIAYTQDESYYILEAEPGACVYLGLKTGVRAADLFGALEVAQAGGSPLDVEAFVNRWPAGKHDHFAIPAGTIHCSGQGTMVLEISATPYIFTFKLWDWGRLGLDGLPRPVHLEHGRAVLQESRDTGWVEREVLNRVEPIAETDGVREERTGLHPLEFIETRRHWFTGPVEHDTAGSVQVLNLVEGEGAVVESPDGAFEPFPVGYAETFIVPAAVGRYRIRPKDGTRPHATIRASVRI
jgi:mannose-6-phosphate isomerase class I